MTADHLGLFTARLFHVLHPPHARIYINSFMVPTVLQSHPLHEYWPRQPRLFRRFTSLLLMSEAGGNTFIIKTANMNENCRYVHYTCPSMDYMKHRSVTIIIWIRTYYNSYFRCQLPFSNGQNRKWKTCGDIPWKSGRRCVAGSGQSE